MNDEQNILNQLSIREFPFNGRLYARPDQDLKQHILNMQAACTRIPDFSRYDEIQLPNEFIEDMITILIGLHDFGKISPIFQWKIVNKTRAPTDLVELSYHTVSGAIFTWLYLDEYIRINTQWLEKKMDQNGIELIGVDLEGIMKSYSSKIVMSILNHHSPVFPDHPQNYLMDSKLSEIISLIEYTYTKSNYDLNAYFSQILNLNGYKEDNGKNIFDLTLSRFYDLVNQSLFDEEIDDIILDIIEAWEDSILHNSSYLHTAFLHSLLIDLDEWDAKSQIDNQNKHWIDFDWDGHSHLKKEIVTEYRRNKWGEQLSEVSEQGISLINQLRNNLFDVTEDSLRSVGTLYTVHAPTGSGKTLAMFNMAVKLAEKYYNEYKIRPRIYYALPFISITNQVGDQIKDILNIDSEYQSAALTIHHHLASSRWAYISDSTIQSADKQEEDETEFYGSSIKINLWHAEIIVTTFVALWDTLITSSKRKMIRSHRLANSIIIFDEVQGFPTKYWELITRTLKNLIEFGNSTVILGSATQPGKLVENIESVDASAKLNQRLVNQLNRYEIIHNKDPIDLENFIKIIQKNIVVTQKSTLIVVNTKKSARRIFDELNFATSSKFLLSTNVRSVDRSRIISEVKGKLNRNEFVVLVATQVIEAGVDISFEQVFREFAPLDSIIQVAGRCNRGFEYSMGQIQIYNILHEKRLQASYVYDNILLDVTSNILGKREIWKETEIYLESKVFFNEVSKRKKTNIGIEDFQKTRIESLGRKFNLIESYPTESIILLDTQQKIEFYAKTPKKFINLTQKFTINISETDFKLLNDLLSQYSRELIEYPIDKKTNEILHILVLEENDPIYQYNGGLALSL